MLSLSCPALGADLPGFDRTRWGMSGDEIAALYGKDLIMLPGRIEFYGLYSKLVLRGRDFAGLPFTVYFQMGEKSDHLEGVLLERRRQYATVEAWRQVTEALHQQWGRDGIDCGVKNGTAQEVWVEGQTTVRVSLIDIGANPLDIDRKDYRPGQTPLGVISPFASSGMTRRLTLRYTPTQAGAPLCP